MSQGPSWPGAEKWREVLRPDPAGGWWPLGQAVFGEMSLRTPGKDFR